MKPKRLGREINCVKNLFTRNLENCETFRFVNTITSANAFILHYLARNQSEDIYQKTIEEKFSITKSTTSKILKLMEQNGLINRLDVKEDARLKKIVLTEKGMETHKAVRQGMDAIEETAFTDFTLEEKEQLFMYLDRIKNNLKNKKENMCEDDIKKC